MPFITFLFQVPCYEFESSFSIICCFMQHTKTHETHCREAGVQENSLQAEEETQDWELLWDK